MLVRPVTSRVDKLGRVKAYTCVSGLLPQFSALRFIKGEKSTYPFRPMFAQSKDVRVVRENKSVTVPKRFGLFEQFRVSSKTRPVTSKLVRPSSPQFSC